MSNNPTTSPSSHSDSGESTLGSSDEAYSPVPKRNATIKTFICFLIFELFSILGQKRTTSKQGMVNGSRLILCCFMLCVLITNPFNYLLNLIHSSERNDLTEIQSIVGSRTLQEATNNDNMNLSSEFIKIEIICSVISYLPYLFLAFLSTSWRQLVAWMLNLAICLVCLVKLFVYGEPIVPESEMHEYYVYKKKADQLMAEVRKFI